MKKISVNQDICIGCGACQAEYPENFTINDDGLAEVTSNSQVDDDEAEMMEGLCPVGAISAE